LVKGKTLRREIALPLNWRNALIFLQRYVPSSNCYKGYFTMRRKWPGDDKEMQT